MKDKYLKLKWKRITLLSVASITYLTVHYNFGISIGCPFYKITGCSCPSCGVTRMVISLLQFKFKEAYYYNRMIFILIPVFLILLLQLIYRYIRYGKTNFTKSQEIVVYICIILLLLFGVIRNVKGFESLKPIDINKMSVITNSK